MCWCTHHLHSDGCGHSPRLLKGPGEVEQPGSQRRLQHDEHRAERAEPRGVSVRRGAGQKADALPGQFLHDPAAPAPTDTQIEILKSFNSCVSAQRSRVQLTFTAVKPGGWAAMRIYRRAATSHVVQLDFLTINISL